LKNEKVNKIWMMFTDFKNVMDEVAQVIDGWVYKMNGFSDLYSKVHVMLPTRKPKTFFINLHLHP